MKHSFDLRKICPQIEDAIDVVKNLQDEECFEAE